MKNNKISLAFGIFLFSIIFVDCANADWLTDCPGKRIPIIVMERSGVNLPEYVVNISLDTASLISQEKMLSRCENIRFTDSDGTTLIPYWIEGGCNTSNTRIWIRVPNITANSNKTIYMYLKCYPKPNYFSSPLNVIYTIPDVNTTLRFSYSSSPYFTNVLLLNHPNNLRTYSIYGSGFLTMLSIRSSYWGGSSWVSDNSFVSGLASSTASSYFLYFVPRDLFNEYGVVEVYGSTYNYYYWNGSRWVVNNTKLIPRCYSPVFVKLNNGTIIVLSRNSTGEFQAVWNGSAWVYGNYISSLKSMMDLYDSYNDYNVKNVFYDIGNIGYYFFGLAFTQNRTTNNLIYYQYNEMNNSWIRYVGTQLDSSCNASSGLMWSLGNYNLLNESGNKFRMLLSCYYNTYTNFYETYFYRMLNEPIAEVTNIIEPPDYCQYIIISAPCTIYTDGTYCLVKNLYGNNDLIEIRSNNVILDCLGNSIGSYRYYGIKTYYGSSKDNITIRNCTIYSSLFLNASNLNVYNNVIIFNAAQSMGILSQSNSKIFNNTIDIVINPSFAGSYEYIYGKDIEFFDNSIHVVNATTITQYHYYEIFWVVNNTKIYNNYINSSTIGVGFIFSDTNYNVTIYGNYFYAPYSHLYRSSSHPHLVNCVNCNVYNNSFYTHFIISGFNDSSYVKLYDNYISNIVLIGNYTRCLYNVYAFNNSVDNVKYGFKNYTFLDYYNSCYYNVYFPTTDTLDPYISVVFDHDSVDFGDVYKYSYSNVSKTIAIDTNRIDYYIMFNATNITNGSNIITNRNISIALSNSSSVNLYRFLDLSLPRYISYLKSNLSTTANIFYRIYVPNVPPGIYTGKIYITYGVGRKDVTYFIEGDR